MMDDFDNRYFTVSADIQAVEGTKGTLMSTVNELKHKYGNRLVASRYLVSEGRAEFLIAKEDEK